MNKATLIAALTLPALAMTCAAVLGSPPAHADTVAYLVNVTVRPGYNFANAADALSYGHTVCTDIGSGRSYADVIGQIKSHFNNPDDYRLNNSVVADVYAVQHQAGCTNDVKPDPQLRLAAQWHTLDVLNNRNLDADIGSDGSTAQDRANAAGYHGAVAETVAINPALAISGIELINQWYYNPDYYAIMQDCANSLIGVWSANSLDRTVVVAVY